MEALRDGTIDFAAGAAHAPLMAFPAWNGAKLLMALAQRTYWFLVLRSDLNANRGDLSVLPGLRIGAAPGVDLALRQLLIDSHLDPEAHDIRIAPVPAASGPPTVSGPVSFGVAAARALENGEIDGFWANGMGTEVAVQKGIGTVVL